MIEQYFSLKQFNPPAQPLDLKIIGAISRQSNRLSIHYELIGQITEVLIPESAAVPRRKHNLWEETCFEFFLSAKGSQQYWEYNLSPSKDWNLYRFEFYRQKEMKEETAFSTLPFQVKKSPESFVLDLKLNLNKIIHQDQALEIGVSSVIKLKNNNLTYWALTHPGPKPDFHKRAGFIIKL